MSSISNDPDTDGVDFEDGDGRPSKTRLKKQMHALQELGKRLTTLREAQLDRFSLSDKLRIAIREYRRLPNSRGARRRQLQFIGRLMRDYDLDEIEQQLSMLLQPATQDVDNSELEEVRHSVLTEGDTSIEAILVSHPQLDRQVLRQAYLEYQRLRGAAEKGKAEGVERRITDYLRDNLS